MTAAIELAVEKIKQSIAHNLKGLGASDACDVLDEIDEHVQNVLANTLPRKFADEALDPNTLPAPDIATRETVKLPRGVQ